jgi:hypothetical protein
MKITPEWTIIFREEKRRRAMQCQPGDSDGAEVRPELVLSSTQGSPFNVTVHSEPLGNKTLSVLMLGEPR